ncbi:MAG: hypothetical protein AB8D52_04810 [Gammaproteobacteria bacterium]
MNFLIVEMFLYLFGIALFGVLIGWVFTRATWKRKMEEVEVNLFGQLYDVNKQLDETQLQLAETKTSLEEAQLQRLEEADEIQEVRSKLLLFQNQSKAQDQKVLELNQSFEEASQQKQKAELNLEKLDKKNQQLTNEYDLVKNRVSAFEIDLDEIVQQSEILKSALEHARIELSNKDKRLAELESEPLENSSLVDSSLNESSEPELAISRIARLQTRVQELFDEVDHKDQELEKLKGSITVAGHSAENDEVSAISNLKFDDLQEIKGIGSVLESKLHDMGVTRFKDIAKWDDSDIARFDQMFDFSGRIGRENWVGQARKLGARFIAVKKRGH